MKQAGSSSSFLALPRAVLPVLLSAVFLLAPLSTQAADLLVAPSGQPFMVGASDPPGLTAREVADSRQALARLESGEADFALVQEDHLERWRGDGGRRATVVGRLGARPLFVLVREPLYLENLAALSNLTVALGPDADARASLERLLDRLGLPRRRLASGSCAARWAERPLATADLARCFRAGTLDVALLLGSPRGDPVEDLQRQGLARLVSLDYRALRLLREPTEREEVFVALSLPRRDAGSREWSTPEVRTVAVPLVLVARSDLGAEVVRPVGEALLRASRSLADRGRFVLPPAGLEPIDLPPAAWTFGDGGRRYGGLWTLLSVLPLATLLVALLVFVARSRRAGVRRLRQSLPLIVAVILVPTILVLVILGTYLAEHRYNEHFSSPSESFWSITVYLFSGLEDRSPYTPAGKAAAAVGLLLGPLLFTVATGWVASRFIHWERKMPKNLRDHYLMLNWNPRGLEAVRQIHHPVIVEAEGTGVIIVLSDDADVHRQLKQDGMGSDPFFEDLFVSIGDPTHERALLNANAQDTRAVLILADERLGGHADERTIRSLFMLRKIARDHGRKDLHVVAELVNPANQEVCEQISQDFPGLLEWVSRGDVRSRLLAQATLHGGMVDFFKDLLSVSAETNELYALTVPDDAVGHPFREYAAKVMTAPGAPAWIPVGIRRTDGSGGRILCNPRQDSEDAVLRRGDQLVLLAYEPPRASDLPCLVQQRTAT